MPHAAIIGSTGSGKTYLAQDLARIALRRGRGVMVLHKEREPWPLPAGPLTFQTHNPEHFLAVYWRARSCDCFMELADADVDKFDSRFHRCFTQGRHEGHRNFYLSQRAAMVHPNVRENCASLYLFAVPIKGARLWADEFNDAALLAATTLPPRYFFHKPSRFRPARLCTLAAAAA